ncbi:hypothetical protein CPC08DRAFT_630389, partial [Agrocybe pediades]
AKLTHEVGHWLGLFHTFEGECYDEVGDNIADTLPQAFRSDGCPKGRDKCPGDTQDLINNFMDYSYDSCMDSFTKGQAVRMRESATVFRRPGGKVAPSEKKKASTTTVLVFATTVTVTATISAAASPTASLATRSVPSTSTLFSFVPSSFLVRSSGASTTSSSSASTIFTHQYWAFLCDYVDVAFGQIECVVSNLVCILSMPVYLTYDCLR